MFYCGKTVVCQVIFNLNVPIRAPPPSRWSQEHSLWLAEGFEGWSSDGTEWHQSATPLQTAGRSPCQSTFIINHILILKHTKSHIIIAESGVDCSVSLCHSVSLTRVCLFSLTQKSSPAGPPLNLHRRAVWKTRRHITNH